jgi:hypothetical protein
MEVFILLFDGVVKLLWRIVGAIEYSPSRLRHKTGHVDEFLIHLIESRLDLVTTRGRVLRWAVETQRLVESVFIPFDEVVGNLYPFIQGFKVRKVLVVVPWSWRIGAFLPREKVLALCFLLFVLQSIKKLIIYLLSLLFLNIRFRRVFSSVAARPWSVIFCNIPLPRILGGERRFAPW